MVEYKQCGEGLKLNDKKKLTGPVILLFFCSGLLSFTIFGHKKKFPVKIKPFFSMFVTLVDSIKYSRVLFRVLMNAQYQFANESLKIPMRLFVNFP